MSKIFATKSNKQMTFWEAKVLIIAKNVSTSGEEIC